MRLLPTSYAHVSYCELFMPVSLHSCHFHMFMLVPWYNSAFPYVHRFCLPGAMDNKICPFGEFWNWQKDYTLVNQHFFCIPHILILFVKNKWIELIFTNFLVAKLQIILKGFQILFISKLPFQACKTMTCKILSIGLSIHTRAHSHTFHWPLPGLSLAF